MADVTINQPLGDEDMDTAAILHIAFQNHTAAMTVLSNGIATTNNLLDKVSVKKFDEVGTIEAAGVARVANVPPQ